ncbi:ATP dependent RNA helicase [Purpureocillium lavendulum]|uniref:ATP dependent RNA helicase n=1 Tax=Purpureocillium lavendulum TaxID=1247861 RepID=A0AB34FWD9_9HYPO|nr:ATP dependent RNA helicase [Purpureocillium lavendulum]
MTEVAVLTAPLNWNGRATCTEWAHLDGAEPTEEASIHPLEVFRALAPVGIAPTAQATRPLSACATMAGAKKKKKPAANPARGFATTSIASKPRPEAAETVDAKPLPPTSSTDKPNGDAPPPTDAAPPSATAADTTTQQPVPLSADEFEKQLDESALQLLVEKHAQKAKRDAQRQRSRLETDRRLLRNQADTVNIPKWLPPDLMDYILDIIKAEARFASSSISAENAGSGKIPSEDDLVLRLWTLRQTLEAVAFPEHRVEAALQHILDIASSVSNASKDSIWGLDEALDWLARECSPDELPPYEFRGKPISRETPSVSPFPSRPHTPKPDSGGGRRGKDSSRSGAAGRPGKGPSKKLVVTYDVEIEPEDLVPEYVSTKAKLLELTRGPGGRDAEADGDDAELAIAKLEAKLHKIENDVLFDKVTAEMKWKSERIVVEKQLAAAKKEAQEASSEEPTSSTPPIETKGSDEDDVAAAAERMAAEILAETNDDDDDDIAGLFASLPQHEVDPSTGKTHTVINSADGSKMILRDFGKWTGISPRRVLEEACRARDASIKINYTIVSEATFASRQSIDILWTKPQEPPTPMPESDVEIIADPTRFMFTMQRVAAPDNKQSEAYIATSALFHVFSGNAREEKSSLRLPAVWRDLWNELAEAKKEQLDSEDRAVVRSLRTLVRQRHDQELEDGVILQGAFRGRGSKAAQDSSESTDRKKPQTLSADEFKKIWVDKSGTRKFQQMLGKPCKIYCTEPRRISAISLARRVSEELGENRNDLGTNRSLVGYSIRLEANTSRETRLVYATTGIVMRMLEGSNDLREVTHLVLDEVHERTIDSDFLLIVLKRLLVKRKDLKVVLMSATVDAERFSKYLGGAPVLNVPGRTFPVDVRYLEDAIEITKYKPTNSPADKMIDLDDDATEEESNGPKSDLSQSLAAYSSKTRNALSQLDEYHIEFDLIVQLMAHIASDASLEQYSKAILVFLPGIAEIRTLNDLLLGDPRFAREWLVYPLHSSIATEDQESAFLVPPPGMRKIVLATNIAETGITIPDVTCVIDTGKHREMRFDERRQLSRLIDTFISRANAKQRRGRAGRVQNGLCFHMFTKYRHDNLMSDQQTPEMLRLSLQDLAIRVKICKIGGIEETLGDALDPPSAKNIRRAIDALVDVRALTAGEELTPLGHQLARLPLDVFLGKLILLGTVFKSLDMAITVAAILSSKSPFSAPFGQRAQADNARMAFRRADSDLLTIYNAYVAWKRVCQANSAAGKEFQFCRKNFLSQQTLANIEDLKGQLLVSLADSGFLSLTEDERRALKGQRFQGGRGRRQQNFFDVPHRVNINSDNDLVSSSVIAWSFYPKLLVRDTPGSKGLRNIGNNQSISLHPSSVNRTRLDIKWLSYYHIMQSKTVYHAHETTACEPFAIALLCGDVRCDMFSGVIVLDGNRGRFALPDWKAMLVVKVLRTRLRELLTRSFRQPGKLPTAQQEKWLDVWQRLFSQDNNNNTTGGSGSSLLQGQDARAGGGASVATGRA